MTECRLMLGDCLEVMKTLEANSVHSIVCDPPYMLNFMGKAFDRAKDNPAASVEVWAEALRVAKPGAHLLAFGGDRTHHRMMTAIEDAGWEIRTCLYWIFGSGFPKSHDISKALDRMAGAEREVIGKSPHSANRDSNLGYGANLPPEGERFLTAPATDAARQWRGWGTSLKPAAEIIVMARKPLSEPTVAQNVLVHGCGGLNIDASRIGTSKDVPASGASKANNGYEGGWGGHEGRENGTGFNANIGRWPSNLLLDDQAAALLDEMSGERGGHSAPHNEMRARPFHAGGWQKSGEVFHNDSGGASRFFLRVAHEPLCALCSCPNSESHGIMNEKGDIIPCEKSANNVGTNSSPRITTVSNGSVATNAQDFGQQSNGGKPELSNAPVSNAAKSIEALQVSASTSALTSAEESRSAQIAQSVKSAENLCDLCATSIAQSIVAMQQGQSPESILGQAFMPERKRQILTKCLASFVALLGNTDTIPTMDGLSLLFGSVRDAMQNSIQIDAEANVAAQTSRLAYHSKASKRDRDEGLEGMELQPMHLSGGRAINTSKGDGTGIRENRPRANHHPTVKPTALMRYLVRLVTPPNGTILDPFLGSGSTLKAAKLEGFNGVGIEIDPEYLEIARRRIAAAQPEVKAQLPLLELAAAEEAHQ